MTVGPAGIAENVGWNKTKKRKEFNINIYIYVYVHVYAYTYNIYQEKTEVEVEAEVSRRRSIRRRIDAYEAKNEIKQEKKSAKIVGC